MLQDSRKLRFGKPHVERHYDPASLHNSVVAFEQLMGVEAQIGDAVALPDAEPHQRRGQPLATFAELRVGELLIAADDADLGAEHANSPVKTAGGGKLNEHAKAAVYDTRVSSCPLLQGRERAP